MTTKGFDWRAAATRCPLPPPLLMHDLVARFWLPLSQVLITSNVDSRGIKNGAASKALETMREQLVPCSSVVPLQIATVRVRRYSDSRPDDDNGASKIPVDRLLPTRPHKGKTVHGLGLILEDDHDHCRKLVEWEFAPPRKGAVLVEVWSPRDRASWELGQWTVDDVERARELLAAIAVDAGRDLAHTP